MLKHLGCCLCSRAAEDELMTVADEKDKLAPQLEEARWRNRQLEKDVQQLQEASSGREQVLYAYSGYCMPIAACTNSSQRPLLQANLQAWSRVLQIPSHDRLLQAYSGWL